MCSEDSRFRRFGLRLGTDPVKGRGLYCDRNFQPGDLLLAGAAFSSISYGPTWTDRCAVCRVTARDAPGGKLQVCGGCGLLAFCSEACRTADIWHGTECQALPLLVQACKKVPCGSGSEQQAAWSSLLRQLVLVARALRFSEGWEKDWGLAELEYEAKALEYLERGTAETDSNGEPLPLRCRPSDLARMAGPASAAKLTPEQCTFAVVLITADPMQVLLPKGLHKRYLSNRSSAVKEVVHCRLQMQHNNFLMYDCTFSLVAEVCDPITALLNHSCEPNAVIVWQSPVTPGSYPKHAVRCIKPLKSGEEVLIAYVDPGLPWWQRRESLLSAYSFECRCEICHEIDEHRRQPASGGGLPRGLVTSLETVSDSNGFILANSGDGDLLDVLKSEMGLSGLVASPKDIAEAVRTASLKLSEFLPRADASQAEPEARGSLSAIMSRQRLDEVLPSVKLLLAHLSPRHLLLRSLAQVLLLAEACADWGECRAIAGHALAALAEPSRSGLMSLRSADVLAIQAKAQAKQLLEQDAAAIPADEAEAACREALRVLGLLHGRHVAQQPRDKELRQLLGQVQSARAKVLQLDAMD